MVRRLIFQAWCLHIKEPDQLREGTHVLIPDLLLSYLSLPFSLCPEGFGQQALRADTRKTGARTCSFPWGHEIMVLT